MECIVIGERVYRLRHRNLKYIETTLWDWNALTEVAVRINSENYIKAYRESLGVPLQATMDEEASYVHETYGPMPYKNPEFVERLHDTLGYKHEKLPDFVNWLGERGIEAAIEANVYTIDEEVD